MLTNREQEMIKEIEYRLTQIRAHLLVHDFPNQDDIAAWYSYLAELKAIQGNFNIDVSFIATLLAKQYLVQWYGLQNFDASDKPQGAPGIDIVTKLPDERLVIAEIKTTSPYKSNDLGAKQIESFRHDFIKLANTKADIKLFFVTELATFELMKQAKYRSQLTGIQVVLLPSGMEFTP